MFKFNIPDPFVRIKKVESYVISTPHLLNLMYRMQNQHHLEPINLTPNHLESKQLLAYHTLPLLLEMNGWLLSCSTDHRLHGSFSSILKMKSLAV